MNEIKKVWRNKLPMTFLFTFTFHPFLMRRWMKLRNQEKFEKRYRLKSINYFLEITEVFHNVSIPIILQKSHC